MLRRMMLTIAVIAPLAWSNTVSAQSRGQDRAPAVQPSSDGNATGRPTTLPPGIARRVSDGEKPLPPGIARTRPQVEPESTPEPVTPEPVTPEPVTPEPVTPGPVTPEPEPCDVTLVYLNGMPYFRDCNGIDTPVFPGG